MNKNTRIRLAACAAVAIVALSSVRAEDDYSCTLRVGNPNAAQTISEKGDAGKSKKATKTVCRVVTWPVSGSICGKRPPSIGDVSLICYFIGTKDGKPTMLEMETKNIVLDDKGNFKLDVTAPADKLVHTTTVKKSRRRGGRHGGRRSTIRSTLTKSSTSGTHVTGCIIQLLVKEKVERAYVSNSGWSLYAKKYPLPEAEVLKTH